MRFCGAFQYQPCVERLYKSGIDNVGMYAFFCEQLRNVQRRFDHFTDCQYRYVIAVLQLQAFSALYRGCRHQSYFPRASGVTYRYRPVMCRNRVIEHTLEFEVVTGGANRHIWYVLEVRQIIYALVRLAVIADQACPVNCITIETMKVVPGDPDQPKLKDGASRKLWVPKYDIDFAKCCFCSLCTEPCPTEAIRMTTEFEYSEYKRDNLLYHFSDMSAEMVEQKRKMLAEFDAKQKAEKAAAAAVAAAAAPKKTADEAVAK
jgi:NADH-quinone oxidoreductase subunit I